MHNLFIQWGEIFHTATYFFIIRATCNKIGLRVYIHTKHIISMALSICPSQVNKVRSLSNETKDWWKEGDSTTVVSHLFTVDMSQILTKVSSEADANHSESLLHAISDIPYVELKRCDPKMWRDWVQQNARTREWPTSLSMQIPVCGFQIRIVLSAAARSEQDNTRQTA